MFNSIISNSEIDGTYHHKSTYGLGNALISGLGYGLIFNSTPEVMSNSTSNTFLIKNNKLFGTTNTALGNFELVNNESWLDYSAGAGYSMGIKTNGTMWSIGTNNFGQQAQGDTTSRSVLTQVGTDTDWLRIECSQQEFTLAIKTDGTLWFAGLIGTSSLESTFIQVGSATNWVNVQCGFDKMLMLNSNGDAYESVNPNTLTLIYNSVSKISYNYRHGGVLKTNGDVIFFGHDWGIAGMPNTGSMSNAIDIETGRTFSIALINNDIGGPGTLNLYHIKRNKIWTKLLPGGFMV